MTARDASDEFLPTFLDEARDLLLDWERHCFTMQDSPSQTACDALFRTAHNLKGSARSVGLDEFATLIHKAEDLITLVRSGRSAFTPKVGRGLLDAQAALSAWRDLLAGDAAAPRPAGVDELVARLIGLARPGEAAAGAGAAPDDPSAFGFFDEAAPPAPRPAAAPKNDAPPASNESVRVQTSKIDGLMQLVGELAIQQATIAHHVRRATGVEQACNNAIAATSKLMRELQRQTMGLRLIGVERLFQRLERTARDLAFDQGKQLEIAVEGADVELDKSILDRITDPLVHMVRNAVDHGVEAPDARGAKGAPAHLRLAATQTAGGVSIEVSDDGRGIDPERVRRKALEAGLLPEGSAASDAAVLDCIFAPGFSTASQVTEVSGRGVGLDVVRRALDELGGSVQVASRVGEGTRFTLTLPTNVSIVDSLIILVDDEHYVVPIQEIAEVIDMRGLRVETRTDRSTTVALRDAMLTVRRLGSYLPLRRAAGQAPGAGDPGKASPAMIVEIGGQRVAFAVDRVVGQQPVVIRKISGFLAQVPGFAGSTVLATGEPAIIVSPRVFARQFFAQKEAG